MSSLADTLAALWEAVEEKPDDTARWLVLADALHDSGDYRMEKAVRWCVEHRKWPQHEHWHQRRMYSWHSIHKKWARRHWLPKWYRRWADEMGVRWGFNTFREAVEIVGYALAETGR